MTHARNPTRPSASPDVTALRRFLNALPKPMRRQRLLEVLCKLRFVSPDQHLAFNGHAKAWVDLRDSGSRSNYIAQMFWPEFPPMVLAFLRNGGDFLDVGANFGLVTFAVLSAAKDLDIEYHLFEANRRIIPLLERSARAWPGARIRVNHCCVTDRPGVSRHFLPDAFWGHGLIADRGEVVPNLVLDDYIAQQGIGKISFLKVDVEGWELHVLRGAERAILSEKVQAGFIEVSPALLKRTGASAEDLLALLEGLGFDAYFSGLWESKHPRELAWAPVSVNGTPLRVARASPLPATFVQDDVLVIHRSNPLAEKVREETRGTNH